MAHVPASKAGEEFADTINRVAYSKERVVLRRRGREVAAVVPIDDVRLLEDLDDCIDLAGGRAALAETKKKRAREPFRSARRVGSQNYWLGFLLNGVDINRCCAREDGIQVSSQLT